MKRQRLSFLIAAWILASRIFYLEAQAQEAAAVLPAKVHRMRLINIFAQPITEAYNSAGRRENVVARMNQKVPLEKLTAVNDSFKSLVALLNGIDSGLGDKVLDVDLESNATFNNHLIFVTLERGFTDRLSGGFSVPFVQQSVKADFRANVRNNSENLGMSVKSHALAQEELKKFNTNLPNTATFEKALFLDKGYKVPGDFKMQTLADIEAGLRYQFLRSDQDLAALTLGLRFPTTSHKPDYTNILDRGIEGITDNQFDVGLQFVNDFLPYDNLIFGTAVQYTFQMPDSMNRPVPRPGEDSLPDLKDPYVWDNVRRNMGDLLETEVSATHKFFRKSISLWTAYQFKYKGSDKYSGGKTLDYTKLSTNTDYSLHRLEFGLGYSAVPAFLRHKIFAPFDIRLSYNTILKARNRPRAPYARLDLWTYF